LRNPFFLRRCQSGVFRAISINLVLNVWGHGVDAALVPGKPKQPS
jgi:hypothetical protein